MSQYIVALALRLPKRKDMTLAAFSDAIVEADSEFDACCDYLQSQAEQLGAEKGALKGLVVARQQNDRRYWTARQFVTMPAPADPEQRAKMRILRGDVAYALQADGMRLLFARVLAIPSRTTKL